jgi:ribonuclease HI
MSDTNESAPSESAPSESAQSDSAPSDSTLSFVQLFTDGSCRGNPGPGGWAYILRHPATGTEKEASGGEADSTNNRMELQAIIEGLAVLTTRTEVEIITDSTYAAKGSHEWMPKWKSNDWRRREKGSWKPVKNEDLWRRLDELLAQHDIRFTMVRGHTGHTENERCDELAVEAAIKIQQG